MSMTPGPNNIMVVASGAIRGFARTVPHRLGIAAGFPVMLVILGTTGRPLLTAPHVRALLKEVGAAYPLRLAWTIANSDPDPVDDPATKTSGRPLGGLQTALFRRST